MSSGMPELGSRISLISKADIRYEGKLFTVDAQECTIALSEVRSYGTEDRVTDYPVPAQNQVYDFILFRGSDIKDIRVLSTTIPNDPAIVQLSVPPTISAAYPRMGFPPQQPFMSPLNAAQSFIASAAPVMSAQPQDQRPKQTHNIFEPLVYTGAAGSSHGAPTYGHVDSASTSVQQRGVPSSPAATYYPKPATPEQERSTQTPLDETEKNKSPQRKKQDRATERAVETQNRERTESGSGDERQKTYANQKYRSQHQQERKSTSYQRQNYNRQQGRVSSSSFENDRDDDEDTTEYRQQNYNAPRSGSNRYSSSYVYTRGGNYHRGAATGARRGGRGYGGVRSSGDGMPTPYRQGGQRGGMGSSHYRDVYNGEYDFERANSQFEELKSQLARMNLDDETANATGADGDSGNERSGMGNANEGEHDQEDGKIQQKDAKAYYDKTKSFFDNISCEALERSKGNVRRVDWKREHRLNCETFGMNVVRRIQNYSGAPRGGGYYYYHQSRGARGNYSMAGATYGGSYYGRYQIGGDARRQQQPVFSGGGRTPNATSRRNEAT